MVEIDIRPADRRCMAGVTLRISGNMGYRFTRGYDAVVAARTGAGHARVIEGAGAPGNRSVAGFTGFAGHNVIIRLADRIHIVVAGFAASRDIAMIESDTCPSDIRNMAVIAGCAGLNMVSRFSRGGDAVMTAFTGAGHDRVIKSQFQPVAGGGMTGFTSGGSRHMGVMHPGCPDPIVA